MAPEKFRGFVAELLGKLEAEELVIDRLQVGNEIGWSGFNGDLPIHPVGEEGEVDRRRFDALPPAVAEGIRRAGECATIAREEVDRLLPPERRPEVVLGSLNDPQTEAAPWFRGSGHTLLPPEHALRLLRGTMPGQPRGTPDLLAPLGAVAVHLYPRPRSVAADASAVIDPMRAVTEAGFPLQEFPDEAARGRAFEELLSAIEGIRTRRRNPVDLRGVYVFSWNQMEHRLKHSAGEPPPAWTAGVLGWRSR